MSARPSSMLSAAMTPVILLASLSACASSKPRTDAPAPRDSVQVGYGTQDRRTSTERVASVDGDQARRATASTAGDLIEGRFPGVEVRQVAGGISVRIRGQRSLMSSNEPLYVVDGIPMQAAPGGVLADIAPHDIKTITVLKDAGSLAAYGARGANGVVLITLRRQ